MFSKNSEKLECLVGAHSDFQGEFTVKGALRVDGRIEGRVHADCVILSETGVIKGEVVASKIVIGGRMEGIMRAKEILEIKATGKALGEVSTNRISITEGGELNGKIEMKMHENKILELVELADSPNGQKLEKI